MPKDIISDVPFSPLEINRLEPLVPTGMTFPVDTASAWRLIDQGTQSTVWNGSTILTYKEQVFTLARGYTTIAAMPLMTSNGLTLTGDMAVTGMSQIFRPFDTAMTFVEFDKQLASSYGILTNATLRWQWIVSVLGAWQAKTEAQRFQLIGTAFP